MIPLSLAEIAAAVDGRLTPSVAAEGVAQSVIAAEGIATAVIARRVVLDSRTVSPGDLFVAIVGQTCDGHDYLGQAVARGAVACVVNGSDGRSASNAAGTAVIEVADTTAALGALAREVRARLTCATVVAVTGSSGKTGTKDLLAAVLTAQGTTVAPPGSFNNELGLPMTILTAERETRFLVLEMGARGIGHIDYLVSIGRPDIGVVLNVGTAHVGEFGSIEQVAVAKSEIVTNLPVTGTAVLNADDPRVLAMADKTNASVMTFGTGASADVRISDLVLDALARPQFTLTVAGKKARVAMKSSGAHQALNATAAAAVGIAAGRSLDDIAVSLSSADPVSRWRMEVTTTSDGTIVVNDAYNANLESMTAALNAVVAMRAGLKHGARTWAVLGEMLELGAQSGAHHETLGRLTVELGIDRVIGVGKATEPMIVAAAAAGYDGGEAVWVPEVAAAIRVLRAGVAPGDVVLVKASRAIGLEDVAATLITEHGDPA